VIGHSWVNVLAAEYRGSDWLCVDNVQLCWVRVTDKSADDTRSNAVLLKPWWTHWLQSIRLTQLQACLSDRRSQRTPTCLTSWSVSDTLCLLSFSYYCFVIILDLISYFYLFSYFLCIVAFTQNVWGTEWPFTWWCAVKKLFTYFIIVLFWLLWNLNT